MELSITITGQVIVMFGLILIGFILTKVKFLTKTGATELTSLLLYVVAPCVLINAYEKEMSVSEAKKLGLAALFTLIVHIMGIIICSVVFRKKDEQKHYRINAFASIYSNCGFMAIPILSASLGTQGVFYGSMYLAVFTTIYWTHGVYLCTGGDKKEISIKKCFLNPGVIGTLISMGLFLTNFWFRNFPKPVDYALGAVKSVVAYMASLNTPVAMIVLGFYMAQVDFKRILKKPSVYIVSLLRLVVIPIIGIYLAKMLRFDPMVAKAVIIPAACPTANVCTLFAAKYNLDAVYASELVSVTTLLSIVTIPLVVLLL